MTMLTCYDWRFRRTGWIAALLLLLSCSTTNHLSPEKLYVEPDPSSGVGEITGEHHIGISISGYSAYLSSVDGKRFAKTGDWKSPHWLSPGTHNIVVEYAHLARRVGYGKIVEIKAGHKYHINLQVKNGFHVVYDKVKFWLTDETESKIVTVFFDGEIGNAHYTLFPSDE